MRLSLIASMLLAGSMAARAEWPQFRGPDGGGHSSATDLPTRWGETDNVAWKAAVEGLPGDLRKKVPLRKVALSRLEKALAKHAADGRGIPDEIEKLAGLTRVQYVFVYPAEGDTPGEVGRLAMTWPYR